MLRYLIALAFTLCASASFAQATLPNVLNKQGQGVQAGASLEVGLTGEYEPKYSFYNHLSTTKTRIANTTAYAGTSASPVAICLFTSSTACVAQSVTLSTLNLDTKGVITSLSLTKSSTGATGATFRVYAYQDVPTLTSVFDTTVYTPKIADITASKYIGAWECGAQTVNGDNSRYNCTSATNDTHQNFKLTDGKIYFVLTTTGAYAPASGETFYVGVNTVAEAM